MVGKRAGWSENPEIPSASGTGVRMVHPGSEFLMGKRQSIPLVKRADTKVWLAEINASP